MKACRSRARLAAALLAISGLSSVPAEAARDEDADEEEADEDTGSSKGKKTSDDEEEEADEGTSGDESAEEDDERGEVENPDEEAGTRSEDDESSAKPPAEAKRHARFWIGFAAAFDFLVLPAAKYLCKRRPNWSPWSTHAAYCTAPGGKDFPSTQAANDQLLPDRSGTWRGGLIAGNTRFLLTADYAVAPELLIGLRAGYVGNSFEGEAEPSFHPVGRHAHVELRGTYLFGDSPLSQVGFVPMAFLGAGASEFDGHIRTYVAFQNVAGKYPMDAWLIGGPWFVTVGGGARYQFSARTAFTLAARMNAAFGNPGFLFTAGPEIGLQYGF